MPRPATRSTAVARILAFELESVAAVADELTLIPEGWVARTPRLPFVWSLNHVGLTHPVEFAEAVGLVDEHMAELPYRQLIIEDEPTGERLEAEFRSRGWKVDRNVLMALRREPDRVLDTSHVIEVDEADALVLMARWIAEDDQLPEGGEAHRQVVEATRLTWRARRARHFGVLGRDGALAGITMLFSDGQTAQVEDVYVVAQERGRGFGRTLVTRAALVGQDTGHDLVFVPADDYGWPKELYAAIGFEAVVRNWVFHR